MGLLTLLLPGMHGTSRLFGRLMRVLPAGLAPRPLSYPTNVILGYDALVKRIELPDEPFAIVAESYSGPVAIRIAARRPAHLCGLVLVATFVRSPWPMVPRWAVQLLRPWLFKIPLPQVGMRRGLLGDDAPPDEVAELVEEQRRCRPEVLAARLRDVLSVDVRDDFKQIDVPILYLRGTRDRVVPSRVGQELQQLQPDIRMATLHSAHAVLQRKPTEAAAVIGQFLLSGMMPQISNRRGTIGRLRSSY